MNSSRWLKNIFSVMYYLLIISSVILFGILLYSVFINSTDILAIMENKREFKITSENALYTYLVYDLVLGIGFIYILYLFKNLMQDLITGPLFTNLQITSFKLIGQLIIFITILNELFRFVYKVIFNKRIEINFDHFNLWFVIFGLFLIFLSTIFNQARIIKEENELTV